MTEERADRGGAARADHAATVEDVLLQTVVTLINLAAAG